MTTNSAEKINQAASQITKMMKRSKKEMATKKFTLEHNGISITLDGNYHMLSLHLPSSIPANLAEEIKFIHEKALDAIQVDLRQDLMSISQAIGQIKDDHAT